MSTSRTQVVVVSHSTSVWGAEKSMLRLAPILRDHGVDATLAAPPGEFEQAWRHVGLPTVSLRLPAHRGIRESESGRRPGPVALVREAAVVATWSARLIHLARRYDVVHSNSLWGHPECVLSGRVARRGVVIEVHDIVAPGIGRRLLDVAARHAQAVVAVSEAVADCLPTCARDRICVLPQGVDSSVFHPGPADPALRQALGGGSGPLIAVVGRIDPAKNIATVVEAVARTDTTNGPASLAIVGAPFDDKRHYEELRRSAQTGLGDRVRFVGRRDDIPEVMRTVDVLVSAADAEPFGLTLLEAQASGTPVVAAASGGPLEFIEHETTGLLTRPGDPDALAAALHALLSDRERRESMVDCALARVRSDYSLEARARKLAAIYHRVAR